MDFLGTTELRRLHWDKISVSRIIKLIKGHILDLLFKYRRYIYSMQFIDDHAFAFMSTNDLIEEKDVCFELYANK